jgi:outer membrane protein OmpA-like peptidoglycan-associated protein
MSRFAVTIGLLAAVAGLSLAEETFRFVYEEGEQYRVLSTVEQDVWLNDLYSHHATILNRIAITVTDVEGGRGFHDATFVTSEESVNAAQVFSWGEEYQSRFWRDELGFYEIEPIYFMPVVRDVPVFPEEAIEPGDTWTRQGSEVHDFRRSFGIPDAYDFPIPVNYRYEGNTEQDGREFALIRVEYNVFYRPNRSYPGAIYPVRISGHSNQLVYWDIAAGRPYSYQEEYAFVFTVSTGDEVLYEGTAEARVIEASRMDRPQVVDEIREDLDALGFEDQEVIADERGVTIRLDNILFPPDSPLLRETERAKLAGIAEILNNYPDRDILITGHTALAGTETGRLQLSRERAGAVATYLLELGVRNPDQIIQHGVGAQEPVADNATESGRRKNRRVEITILEN